MGNAAFTNGAQIVSREESMRAKQQQQANIARRVHRIRSTVEAHMDGVAHRPSLAEAAGETSGGNSNKVEKKEWLPAGACQCDPKHNHGRYSCHLQSLLFKDQRRWCRARKTTGCRKQLVYCNPRMWFSNETLNRNMDKKVATEQKEKHTKETKWKHRNRHYTAEKAHKEWARQEILVTKSQVYLEKKMSASRSKTEVYYDRMRGVSDTHKDLYKAYEALSKKEAKLAPLYEQQNELKIKNVKTLNATFKEKGLNAIDEISALKIANKVIN